MVPKESRGLKTWRKDRLISPYCAPTAAQKPLNLSQLALSAGMRSVGNIQHAAVSANYQWKVCTFGAKFAVMVDTTII